MLLGVGRVREALLEDAYNEAVEAGDFDDTPHLGRAHHQRPTTSARLRVSAANELLRGSVWSVRYLDDERTPVVIVPNDGRNPSRFEWVHVVRITTRPNRSLPTIVELSDRDAPLTGRAMTDEVELVHKADLEDRRGMLRPSTMAAIDNAL